MNILQKSSIKFQTSNQHFKRLFTIKLMKIKYTDSNSTIDTVELNTFIWGSLKWLKTYEAGNCCYK